MITVTVDPKVVISLPFVAHALNTNGEVHAKVTDFFSGLVYSYWGYRVVALSDMDNLSQVEAQNAFDKEFESSKGEKVNLLK